MVDKMAVLRRFVRMGTGLMVGVGALSAAVAQQPLAFLHAHQCEEAQGHYFSPPVPAEQFAQLLERGISSEARAALCTLNQGLDNAVLHRMPRGTALPR